MASLFDRIRSLWTKETSPVPSRSAVTAPQPEPITAPSPSASPVPLAEPIPSGQTVNEELVYHALRKCRDPEIPVNIVDLGLIYDVRVADERVSVKMTLTTQGCGMGGYISQEAEEQIRALPGVRDATVEIVWDPPWDPSMISAAGRKTLGLPE